MSKIKLNIINEPDDYECAQVRVDATVEGDEFDFLLDTGAALSRIRKSEFTIQYPKVKSHASSSVLSKSNEDLIRIPSLKLGPILKENVEFTRVDASHEQVNLIGMNILKSYAFHFDFQNNTLEVNPDGRKYASKVNDLFMDEAGHPYIPAFLGEKECSTVWDTGSSITLVDTKIITEYPKYFRKIGESEGTDANGNKVMTSTYLLVNLTIDGKLFPPHHVAALDLSDVNANLEKPMEMILGYSTFQHADWWFDFPLKKWKITRFQNR